MVLFFAFALPFLRAADSKERSTELVAAAPVESFSIPQFTPDGRRLWLVRGASGRIVDSDRQEISDLHLTVFTGDAAEELEAVLLSAAATIRFKEKIVSGKGLLRLINFREGIDLNGEDWTYDQARKKVSIRKNARVTLRVPLKDLLQ